MAVMCQDMDVDRITVLTYSPVAADQGLYGSKGRNSKFCHGKEAEFENIFVELTRSEGLA